jgi:taurine dioxygenase
MSASQSKGCDGQEIAMNYKKPEKLIKGSTYFIEPADPLLDPERYLPLRVQPLMPGFAATIEGLDLRKEQDEPTKVALREALVRFGVLFFTGQEALTAEQQLRLTGILGVPDDGSPFVPRVAKGIDVLINDADHPPVANLWHSDNSGIPNSSFGTLIQISELPSVGGNTVWCCGRKAYDTLPDRMKHYLEDLVAVHYWNNRGHKETGLDYDEDDAFFENYLAMVRSTPPQIHKIAKPHPITGRKSLFVNETYTKYVRHMHKYESNHILSFLYDWMKLPEFHVVHRWSRNDVAVWDNITMQHYALGDYSSRRVNQRVQFVIDPQLDYLGLSKSRNAVSV